MKFLILATLFISTGSFAQSLDVRGFKALLTQRQGILEKVYPGMSKKLVSKFVLQTEEGNCDMTQVSEQSVLKIEGDKIIVHAKDSYSASSAPACSGIEAQTSASLFFEEKPSLQKDLADLDEIASTIKSITRAGEIVTMNILAEGNDVTVKYDLTKSSFKNTLLIQDANGSITGSDMPDIDVNKVDLRDILFCESAESDNCSRGDWSDILF